MFFPYILRVNTAIDMIEPELIMTANIHAHAIIYRYFIHPDMHLGPGGCE